MLFFHLITHCHSWCSLMAVWHGFHCPLFPTFLKGHLPLEHSLSRRHLCLEHWKFPQFNAELGNQTSEGSQYNLLTCPHSPYGEGKLSELSWTVSVHSYEHLHLTNHIHFILDISSVCHSQKLLIGLEGFSSVQMHRNLWSNWQRAVVRGEKITVDAQQFTSQEVATNLKIH